MDLTGHRGEVFLSSWTIYRFLIAILFYSIIWFLFKIHVSKLTVMMTYNNDYFF